MTPLFYYFFILCFCFPTLLFSIDKTEGIQKVKALVDTYEELLWLADEGVKKTEENVFSNDNKSWSEAFFGEKYEEFERSLMSLRCFELIVNDDYLTFTLEQPALEKLSREHFEDLRNKLSHICHDLKISKSDMIQVVQTALVLGDMGKCSYARELVKKEGFPIASVDHDDFISDAMRLCPHLFPSYRKLSSSLQNLLRSLFGLAHFGHITHLEGGPEMYATLKNEMTSRIPFANIELAFFVHTCDVAGALGHVNNHYSKVLTENTYRALEAVEKSILYLSNSDEEHAYDFYRKTRARWLGLSESAFDHLLTKLGASLRLFNPDEGLLLLKGFSKLSAEDQALSLSTMIHVKKATYIPAVLGNLLNHSKLGANQSERIPNVLICALPFIAKVLKYREDSLKRGTMKESLVLNFNSIAGEVKKDPFCLLTQDYTVNEEGEVFLVSHETK